ncbi:MAG TPA: putative O-glycosylation ligase, exosortase A system-associated [Aliidongia sp.]|nr:putative O-glycosylation ligase, exosortase A system-associated [Aliidongia sp.]
MRDILVLFALLATLPMVFRRPFVGVLLWAWVSFLSPEDYLYGFMQAVPLTKLVSGVTILCVLLSREKKNLYLDKVSIMAGLFAIVGLASSIFSETLYINSWEICERLLKVLVFCFLIQRLVRSQLRVHAVLIAICLGWGFHGAVEGLKVIVDGGNHHVEGLTSFGDNNSFALGIVMVIPILMYLAKYSVLRPVKITYMAVAVLCAFSVIGTFSRGGFIGLVIIAIGMVMGSQRRIRNACCMAVVGIVLLSIAPASWYSRVDTIETANEDSSFMGRVIAWKISTLIALDNPLLGAGFHGVQDAAVWNKYRTQFYTLSFIPTDQPGDLARAAHSIYFEVLGDLGFTGFVLFLSILLISLANANRVRRLTRLHPHLEWAGSLASALRMSLIAYMISGAALSMAYFELFYVLMAVISLLRHMVEQEVAPAGLRKTVPQYAPRQQPLVGAPAPARTRIS